MITIEMQETFDQFGTFLRSSISAKTLNQTMPPAGELIVRYHLPIEAAMFLSRGRYRTHLEARFELKYNN